MAHTATTRIVILGAGYAGMVAAYRLAGKAGQQAHITLVNKEADFIERIRLHQAATGCAGHRHSLAKLLKGTGIDFVQGTVTALDLASHHVTVQTPAGESRLYYDKLIYALGSTIDTRAIPGIRENAYLMTPESSPKLHAALPNARKLLVIGGGLTGIETATELAEGYPQLQVTLATSGEFGAGLSQKARKVLAQTFERLGITVHDCLKITRIDPGAALTAAGDRLEFDVCVWAGAFAVPELAKNSGLAVTERGQIRVDERLRALSHPDIYAAGDAAYLEGIRMACATAEPMAAHVADNLVAVLNGQPEREFRFGYIIRCISLGRSAGLIQFVAADDTPQERILSGRIGALVKELVCRYAFYAMRAERYFPGSYTWLKPKRETKGRAHATL